jgi:catechol 2,3-dioxygenase-like lactoylglutathione lyase family enzyme
MDPHLFAGVRVRDYRAARPWYERLFGEPSFLPHDTEAVWTVAENRSVFIVEHAEAGHAVLLLFLDDLDGWVAEVAGRGLEPTERERYDNGVRKAIYRDPDGNRVEFGGAPVEDAA